MRAIVSVSDKSGLADFARHFKELGIEIYSTGGTKKSLQEAGVSSAQRLRADRFP